MQLVPDAAGPRSCRYSAGNFTVVRRFLRFFLLGFSPLTRGKDCYRQTYRWKRVLYRNVASGRSACALGVFPSRLCETAGGQ